MTFDQAQSVLLSRRKMIETFMRQHREELQSAQLELDAIDLALEVIDRLHPA